MAGSGDRDIAEAGVEQVRVGTGIGIDENGLGGEALGGVAGDSISALTRALIVRRVQWTGAYLPKWKHQ